jgi:hypothetical protein
LAFLLREYMEQSLLAGVATLSLVLLNPSSAPSAPTTSQIVMEKEMRDYTVVEGDTFTSIAEKEYGSVDLWTNLWNDNPWIEDPNIIEKGWVLKLSQAKPKKTAALNSELKEKVEKKAAAIIPVIQANPVSQAQANTVIVPASNPAPAVSTSTPAGPLNEAQMNYLGNCESGMRPDTNTGNGFYGAFQFTIGTWNAMGTGYERADLAPLEVQKSAVQKLLSRSSIFTQFPGCARKMQALGII